MKCHECGHDYPSTITRCTRCGELNPEKRHNFSSSRLIEFPRKAQAEAADASAEAPLPDWRVEVKERVRAARARRIAESTEPEVNRVDETSNSPEIDDYPSVSSAIHRKEKSASTPDSIKEHSGSGRNRLLARSNKSVAPQPSHAEHRPNDHIADAALARVRRASEKARLSVLPKVEPSRPSQSTRAFSADNQATARALEVEINPSPDQVIEPRTEPTTPSENITTTDIPLIEPQPSPYSSDSYETYEIDIPDTGSQVGLDEIEPRDYLEAEVRKFDHLLSGDRTEEDEIPALFTHFIINIIDLSVIAAGSAPFLALTEILNGNFTDSATRISALLMILLVAVFYLAITQTLCGKTFGMMFTSTHIVDSRTYQPPTVASALLRTVGYIFAVIPLMLGLFWILADRKRRGWQDIISGTLVARDF